MPKYPIILLLALFFLTACNSYKTDPQVTPERQAELEKTIQDSQQAIDHYKGEEGTIPYLEIINQAEAYHELGEIGKAIKIYEKTLKDDKEVIVILNNLGRLYDETEQYEKAIKVYQRLNDKFLEKKYLYDITWAYIKMGDLKNAQKYFNAWQLEFKKTDSQTQQAIKDLRDKQKLDS